MSKRFLLVMALITALFVGLLFINKKEAGAPSVSGQVTNHVYGEGKSGVNVTEYGDFECPACYQYYPVFKQLKEKYKDQVTFQFRHFPIVSIHPKAMAAHRAAEAAGRQGKFWEMHDILYEQQNSWKEVPNQATVFEGYATQLGLDMEKFKQDVTSGSVAADIQADIKAGEDAGATGTPTFLIDGIRIDNPNSIEAFEKLIEDAIATKNS